MQNNATLREDVTYQGYVDSNNVNSTDATSMWNTNNVHGIA